MAQSYKVELNQTVYKVELANDSYPVATCARAVTSGAGDVVGPSSSTDNAVARYSLTTGKLLQNSGVIIDDSDNITGPVAITATGTIAGDTVTGTNVTTGSDPGHTHTAYEASGATATHSALTTGVHGVGGGTVAKTSDITTDIATHAALTDKTAHADEGLADPVVYVATGDLGAGAITIDANNGRSQYIDLTAATTLTFTAINNLTNNSGLVSVAIETSGAGITYTFPGSTITTGTAPTAAGEHTVQFERTSDSVLMAFILPTPA